MVSKCFTSLKTVLMCIFFLNNMPITNDINKSTTTSFCQEKIYKSVIKCDYQKYKSNHSKTKQNIQHNLDNKNKLDGGINYNNDNINSNNNNKKHSHKKKHRFFF